MAVNWARLPTASARTIAELRLEAFLPADEATTTVLAELVRTSRAVHSGYARTAESATACT